VTYLADNIGGASYLYTITVFTGMSKEAATTAEISVCVKGDHGTSATHKLEDENVLLFQTGEEDWFIMAETKSLGRLKELTVWVDYSNTAPSW